jgi:hypothetical protein
MKKICWIADVPGWAYDNRAQAIAKALPNYQHVVVLNVIANFSDCLPVMTEADIIVCPDPRIMGFVPGRNKVVLHLNAWKIFV